MADSAGDKQGSQDGWILGSDGSFDHAEKGEPGGKGLLVAGAGKDDTLDNCELGVLHGQR